MAHEDISGYSLRRGLGSGSAGTVWLLRDRATGRHAVVKRIPKTAVGTPTDLLNDLDLARTIDHPHIARLIEVRESDREWLIFSQYVAAGTLTSLLERRGVLSPGELVTLLSPLAQALSLLHRTGLLHGRLTTDNIMFDADGRPVITDAGLSTLAPPTTAESDLHALATIAQSSGGTPKTFPPSLFTTTPDHLAEHCLHQSQPLPIDLGFTSEPHPTPSPRPSNDSHPHAATPHAVPTAATTPPTPANPSPTHSASPPTPATSRLPPSSHSTPATSSAPGASAPPTNLRPPPALSRLTAATSGSAPNASEISATAAHARPVLPTLVAAHQQPQPQPPARERGRLPRPTHRRSARRKAATRTFPTRASAPRTSGQLSDRQTRQPGPPGRRLGHRPVTRTMRQFLSTKRAAYGILAACGAGALATLAIGLATLGVLGDPAGTSTAAADPAGHPSTPTAVPFRTPTTGTQTALNPQATVPTLSTSPGAHPTGANPSTSPGAHPRGANPSTPPGTHPTGANPSNSPGTHTTGGTPSGRPQSARLAESQRWLQVLQGLDAHRSRAFARSDASELDAVYVDRSPPGIADRALIAGYRDQHLRVEGLRVKIEKVSVEAAGQKTVVLRIVDRLISGVAVSDSGGRTAFPPGVPTARRITLTAIGTTWRISAIATA